MKENMKNKMFDLRSESWNAGMRYTYNGKIFKRIQMNPFIVSSFFNRGWVINDECAPNKKMMK